MRCPTCEREFDSGTSSTLPFCCQRCQQVDLGRWLDERYTLPVPPGEDDAEDSESAED